MADNEEPTETKEKRTVPAMVRTPRGVADHAAAVLEMQWDKERKAFKDPVTVMMALFTYAKLTPALLDEATAAANARARALEGRVEKLEATIVAFESWRDDVVKQSAEMAKEFEEMMSGGDPTAKLKEIVAARNTPPMLAPPAPILETVVDEPVRGEEPTTVVPLKAGNKAGTAKKPSTQADSTAKNGGAA